MNKEEKKESQGQATAQKEKEDFLSKIVSAADASDEEEKVGILDLVDNLIELTRKEETANFLDKGIVLFIESQIHKLDTLIGTLLDEILHNQEFADIEGKWRGLSGLVDRSETGEMLKIRLLPASKKEIEDDFNRAADFDQTTFYKKLYTSEYDTFGGKPNTYIILDEYFTSSTVDCKFLTNMAEVGAACHSPVFTACHPKVFNVKKFGDIHKPRDLTKIFESPEKVKWNALREKSDSRYLSLCMPRVMARAPYDPENNPCEELNYRETFDPERDDHFVWMNAAYEVGVILNRSYSISGWPTGIKGIQGGGLIENLPAFTYRSEEGDVILKCPLDSGEPVCDTRERELSNLGFTCICHCKETDKAAFFSVKTFYKPQKYDSDYANANSFLASEMPGVLATSRIGHYVRVMLRNYIGSFKTADEIKTLLQNWVAQYVLLNDIATHELKARFPLKEAEIQVLERPGTVGSYMIEMDLRFHEQFHEATTRLKMVASIRKKS